MKIVFFGTPEYVVPVADLLNKNFKSVEGESPIECVVTQPPKPVGRKKQLLYSPMDTWAYKKNIQILFNPKDLISKKIRADIGILASYGAIIPKDVVEYFPNGILNIHPSLLPKWRGSAPVQATLVSNDAAGATIIKIDEKLDHGPIISQFKDEVRNDDTTKTLRSRLFERAGEVLTTLIPAYLKGKIKLREQDHTKASFTREIKKEDAFIPFEYISACLKGLNLDTDWKIPFIREFSLKPNAENIERFIRAMETWPTAWSEINVKDGEQLFKKRLKILKVHLDNSDTEQQKLVIDSVQLEGKNPVSWKQFNEGYKVAF